MSDWDAKIFVFGHGIFKVKVFDTHCHPASIERGYGAVFKSFDCVKFCCWHAYLSDVREPISTYSPSSSV